MDKPSTTPLASLDRRTLLRGTGATLGAGLIAGLGGCSSLLGGDGGGDSTPRVEAIPGSATAAVYADLSAMLGDEEFRATIGALLADFGIVRSDAASTVTETLDTVEERVRLDPRKVSELLAVFDQERGSVVLLWTDFADATVRERAEARDPPTSTYRGQTVYDFESSSLAALGDGRYAVGTEGGARAAIDRDNGDVPAADGELRTAYETARSGYLQFGVDVPTDQLPGRDTPRMTALRSLQYAYGSLAPDGNSLTLSVSARAEDSKSATQLRDQVEAGLTAAENQLAEAESRPDRRERAQNRLEVLEATEVSTDGPTVTARNSEGAAALVTAVVVGGGFALPLSGSGSAAMS